MILSTLSSIVLKIFEPTPYKHTTCIPCWNDVETSFRCCFNVEYMCVCRDSETYQKMIVIKTACNLFRPHTKYNKNIGWLGKEISFTKGAYNT